MGSKSINGHSAVSTTRGVNRQIIELLKLLPSAFSTGVILYLILWYLRIRSEITIQISILVAITCFCVAGYYSFGHNKEGPNQSGNGNGKRYTTVTKKIAHTRMYLFSPELLFAFGYFAVLLLQFTGVNSVSYDTVFTTWENLSLQNYVSIMCSIALCFFFPGYAVISSMDKKNFLGFLPRFLLGYLISIFITGFTAFSVSYYSQANLFDYKPVFLMVYLFPLAGYLATKLLPSIFSTKRAINRSWSNYKFSPRTLCFYGVFACLIAFTFISSYFLYGGSIIGDQLYHHGRSLLILSGDFRSLLDQSIAVPYLPFFHSVLAGYFSISGVSSVNAYVSISFLNIMPFICFYYFFNRWFQKYKGSALLATVLFSLSSGLGWAHAIYTFYDDYPISNESAFFLLDQAGRTTFDIRLPNSFLNNGTLTTPLIVIGLPAGLTMLGIAKENWNNKMLFSVILFIITLLGILSHEEFLLFIAALILLPIFYKVKMSNMIYLSILIALCTTVVINSFLEGQPFVSRQIYGFPVTDLLIVFTIILWVIVRTNIIQKVFDLLYNKYVPSIFSHLPSVNKKKWIFIICGIVIVIVSYFYIFTFVTWSQLPAAEIHVQTTSQGARIVPWYLYPMRMGVVGILAIAYILSLFYRQVDKEISILLIILGVAFFAMPSYNEFRLDRYVMLSAVGLASLFMYMILKNHSKGTVLNGFILSAVIISSGLSIFIYQGYMDLAIQDPDIKMFMSHRYLPKDIEAMNFLKHNVDLRADNVAIPNEDIHHFRRHQEGAFLAEQIEGFIGLPFENKISQTSSVFQSSSLEGLLMNLNYSNTKYILMPNGSQISQERDSAIVAVKDFFPTKFKSTETQILFVPPISVPDKNSRTALVIPEGSLTANKGTLPVSYTGYTPLRSVNYSDMPNIIETTSSLEIVNEDNVAVDGMSSPQKVWLSSVQNANATYLDLNLQILRSSANDNHGGIMWQSGDKEYNVFLRPHSVSAYDPINKEFARNNNFIRSEGTWYNLKLVLANGNYTVYVDDKPMLTFPNYENETITDIGVSSVNAKTEFSEIDLGRTIEAKDSGAYFDRYYNYYLPMFLLSFSNQSYDTYLEGDLGILSQSTLVFGYDPPDASHYIDKLRSGATMVVINSNGYFGGGFGEHLKLIPTLEHRFNSVIGKSPYKAVGEGITLGITSGEKEIPLNVTAYYEQRHINGTVTKVPFIMEQHIGKGKLIYVNAKGYFELLKNGTDNSGSLMTYLWSLMGLDSLQSSSQIRQGNNSATGPPIRLVGPIYGIGSIEVNSSSLYSPVSDRYSVSKIIHESANDTEAIVGQGGIVTNLSISGPFTVNVKASAFKSVPSLSENSYLPLHLSNPVNLTIATKDEITDVEVSYDLGNNNSSTREKIILNAGETIRLVEFSPHVDGRIPLLLFFKHPELYLKGELYVSEMYSRDPDDKTKWLANGEPFFVNGSSLIKFEGTDTFYDKGLDRHVTFVEHLAMNEVSEMDPPRRKDTGLEVVFPGDISEYAKENNITIPTEKAIFSELNLKVLLTFAIVSIVVIYLSWSRISHRIGRFR